MFGSNFNPMQFYAGLRSGGNPFARMMPQFGQQMAPEQGGGMPGLSPSSDPSSFPGNGGSDSMGGQPQLGQMPPNQSAMQPQGMGRQMGRFGQGMGLGGGGYFRGLMQGRQPLGSGGAFMGQGQRSGAY